MTSQFRKKPVTISAVQWTGQNLLEIAEFAGPEAYFSTKGDLFIDTLNGRVEAAVGDWIIKGVHEEFYPCAPAIFTATYEAV